MNYSSEVNAPGSLARVAPVRAEKFLMSLANLCDDRASVEKFVRDFSSLSPERTVADWTAFASKPEWEQLKRSPYCPLPKELGQLRETLRYMWKEPDLRTRDWIAYNLRFYELLGVDFTLLNPEVTGRQLPPPTPFEQCVLHLRKCVDRARYCTNPSCPAPYFFARRRGQRYCSDACAVPGQREFKRRWWDEHGDKWRSKRKKARRKRRG
jgi:hypothetical protein